MTFLDSLIGHVVRVYHPSLTNNPVGIVTEISATHLVVHPITDGRALTPLILPVATTVLMVYGPADEKHRDQVATYTHSDYRKQL